jgi:hypothetical protein
MTHAAATASAPVLTHLLASVLGHDSDRGETIAHALVGEPIWTGPADAIQLLGVDRDRREATSPVNHRRSRLLFSLRTLGRFHMTAASLTFDCCCP